MICPHFASLEQAEISPTASGVGMVLLWVPTSPSRGEQCGAGDPMALRPPLMFRAATDQFWGGLFFFRHAAADQHTGQ